MSGAQGAQPKESRTATQYESVIDGEKDRPRTDLRSWEDERGVPVEKLQDKVPDATGGGGPVFGAPNEKEAGVRGKQDLGVTGTG